MEEDHCYCAICGTPCGQVTNDICDDEYSYDPRILELDDIYWMSDIKLLTVNRKTGRTVTCNEPEHEGGREFGHWSESRLLTHPDNFGRGVIEVYRITEDRPPVIPLHLSCLKLLEKASKTKINLRVLHAALSKRCVPKDGMDPVALNYGYGQVNKFQRDGYWLMEKWSESVVMDPTKVDGTIVNRMLDETTRDSSTEASPEDEYWKSNLYGNHGWFTMFLPSETQLKKRRIDWRTLHFLIQDLGNGKGRYGHTKTRLQFRNRARVWRVCSSILKDYKVAFEEDKLKPKILSERQMKVEALKRRAEIRAMEKQSEINLMESLSQLHPFGSQEGVNLMESQVWLSPTEKERLISSSTVQSKISQFFRPH